MKFREGTMYLGNLSELGGGPFHDISAVADGLRNLKAQPLIQGKGSFVADKYIEHHRLFHRCAAHFDHGCTNALILVFREEVQVVDLRHSRFVSVKTVIPGFLAVDGDDGVFADFDFHFSADPLHHMVIVDGVLVFVCIDELFALPENRCDVIGCGGGIGYHGVACLSLANGVKEAKQTLRLDLPKFVRMWPRPAWRVLHWSPL